MGVSLNQIKSADDVQALREHLMSVLSDLEDQLNSSPAVYTQGSSKFPNTKLGDVVVFTSGDAISSVKVRTGKDSFATLDQDSIGVTLLSLGVTAGVATQLTTLSTLSQTTLGITLTTLGVHSGAIAQITAGAITQASIGISAGAIAQITAGEIVLTGGGANSLGVTSGVASQITSLSTLSAATLGITLAVLGVTTNFQTQITTGNVVAGVPSAAVAQIESGMGTGRFRGTDVGTNSATFLTADGDWGFYQFTTPAPDEYYVMWRSGGVIRGALMT